MRRIAERRHLFESMSHSYGSLPASMPVVAASVDALVGVRSLQQLFIASHASQLVAAEEEENQPSLSRWSLHGLPLTSRDALDQVRQAPDMLSFMTQRPAPQQETTRFMSSLSGLLSRPQEKKHSFDDLEFVVSTSEAVEIACRLLRIASQIIVEKTPRIGFPVETVEAHQLRSSTHRSTEGACRVLHTRTPRLGFAQNRPLFCCVS